MNFLIACIVFLVTHQATCALEETSVSALYAISSLCADDGVLGCNQDCTAQRLCLGHNEVSINCQAQFRKPFCNPKTLKCEATVGQCGQKPTDPIRPFVCPGVGNYPFATDCKLFWSCPPYPEAQVLSCPGTLIFDVVNKKCAPVSYTNQCVTFSSLCKGKENTVVVHTNNKASYAYCDPEFPVVRECPKEHIFNLNNLTCEFQCKASGVFADPARNNCYYTCTSYYPSYKVDSTCCPDDQIFDSSLMACVPPYVG